MAKFNFGNIIGSAKNGAASFAKTGMNFLDDNLSSGLGSIGSGLSQMGKNLVSESIASLTGMSPEPMYDSPYPLGVEWQPDPAYTVTFCFTNPNTKVQDFVQGYIPDTISMGISADYNSPLESIGENMSGAAGGVSAIARMFGYKVSANMFSMMLWSGSSHIDTSLELRFVALRDTRTDVIEPIRKLYSLITPSIDPFSASDGPIQLGIVSSPGPSLEYAGTGSAVDLLSQLGSVVMDAGSQLVNAGINAFNNVQNGEDTKTVISNAGGATMDAVGGALNNALKDFRVKNNISLKIGEFSILKSIIIKDVTPVYNVKFDTQGNMIDATVTVQIGTFVSPTNMDIPHLVAYRLGADDAPEDILTKLTSVSPLSLEQISTPPFIANGSNAISQVAKGSILPKLTATITTPIKQLKDFVLGNPTTLGKDAGLSYKYTDSTQKPNAPGLTAADKIDFGQLFNA